MIVHRQMPRTTRNERALLESRDKPVDQGLLYVLALILPGEGSQVPDRIILAGQHVGDECRLQRLIASRRTTGDFQNGSEIRTDRPRREQLAQTAVLRRLADR
ncbi:hypothetical protein D3C87_1134840 [compost metagenome]